MEYRFYHMTKTSLEVALFRVLRKVLGQEKKVVVWIRLRSHEMAQTKIKAISDFLWSCDEDLIPHASEFDHVSEKKLNPVWFTTTGDNPIGAEYLFIVTDYEEELSDSSDASGNASDDTFGDTSGDLSWKMIARFFHKDWEESLLSAREAWRSHKDKGLAMTYFQEHDQKGWEKIYEIPENKS